MTKNNKKKRYPMNVTKTGFKYTLDPKRLGNYELVEAIAEVDDNPLMVPKVVKLLLGNQAEKLKEHVRDANGFVSTQKLTNELADIFSNNSIKN